MGGEVDGLSSVLSQMRWANHAAMSRQHTRSATIHVRHSGEVGVARDTQYSRRPAAVVVEEEDEESEDDDAGKSGVGVGSSKDARVEWAEKHQVWVVVYGWVCGRCVTSYGVVAERALALAALSARARAANQAFGGWWSSCEGRCARRADRRLTLRLREHARRTRWHSNCFTSMRPPPR